MICAISKLSRTKSFYGAAACSTWYFFLLLTNRHLNNHIIWYLPTCYPIAISGALLKERARI